MSTVIEDVSENTMRLDLDKLSDLVHYICAKAPGKQPLEASALNRILFFSDCRAYQELGTPISGESYFRQQDGPVPANLGNVLRELRNQERIIVPEKKDITRGKEGASGRVFHSLKPAKTARFGELELRIVDEIVERICLNSAEGSMGSLFEAIALGSANIGEELPLVAVYSNLFEDLHPEELDWW